MKILTESWDEWLSAPVTDTVSAESELSGIVSCLRYKKEGRTAVLSQSRLWVFRRIQRLWPRVSWNAFCEMNDILRVRSRSVSLLLPDGLYDVIVARAQRDDFIRWSWARGVFGCVGSIYNPKRGYYCVLRFHDQAVCGNVCELLAGSDIAFSRRQNDGVWELSIRDLQQIMRFCYFMGLESIAQKLEERSMMRYNRDLANKQANCDSANIRRSVRTSREQRAFIEFLCKTNIDLIPDKLLPLAKARLEHPESSLSDLGDLLRPQVSKSTVKYRLNKLREIAAAAGFVYVEQE